MTNNREIFDRRIVKKNRSRMSAWKGSHDFLFEDVRHRLIEKLGMIRRSFPGVLELGCRSGETKGILDQRHGREFFINCDISSAMAGRADPPQLVANEERLPLTSDCLDLVLSPRYLHSANALPRAFAEILRCLRPDGLFLCALLGGDTLSELRYSLTGAVNSETSELFPRVAPFIQVRDLGDLMQRIGFTMIVVDVDHITVDYPDPFSLMKDLRKMGEGNALNARCKHFTPRGLFAKATSLYPKHGNGPKSKISAKFEILYSIGWAPHPRQQQALRPGAGNSRLEEILG